MINKGGIAQGVADRVDAYRNNPNQLQQRYGQNKQLLDLLALQEIAKEVDAKAQQKAMQMQTNPQTIKDQLTQKVMQDKQMGMQDKISQASGVMRQQAQQQQKNMQNVAKQGAVSPQAMQQGMGALASQIKPQIARMAAGGIVSFQEGRGVTEAMIEEFRRKNPDAVRGMTNAEIAALIRPSGPVRGDSEEGQRRLAEQGAQIQKREDAAMYGDPMPGPKDRPSMIGPYEAEEGAYPFPSDKGIRIGAKDFDKDIIKGAERTKNFLSGLLPDLSKGPAGFFRDKKAAQEEQKRVADISTKASPEATAMADAERKQMTGTAPAMQPPAEQSGIDPLSRMTAQSMQGGIGGLPQQSGVGPVQAQGLGAIGTTSQDATNKILDKTGLAKLAGRNEADVVKAARESADKYTGRKETADALQKRIDDMEAYYKSQKVDPKEQSWRDFLSKAGAAGAAAPGKMGLAVSQTGERLRNERYKRGAEELDKLYTMTKEARTMDKSYAEMGMKSSNEAAQRLGMQQKAVADLMSAASRQDIELADNYADRKQRAMSDNMKNQIEQLKISAETALRQQANANDLLKVEAQLSKVAADLLATDDPQLSMLRKRAIEAGQGSDAQKEYDRYLMSKGLTDAMVLNKIGIYDALEKIGKRLRELGVEPASGLMAKEQMQSSGYQLNEAEQAALAANK